jgi:fibronectin type 3 domain-containing protein
MDLQSRDGATSLTITWQESGTVDGFNVYRSTSPNGPFGLQNNGLVPSDTFDDMNVLGGETYYYEVTAVVAGTESTPGFITVAHQ